MSAVLVLNATYEPLSHTRLGRAIAMISRGEAVVEEAFPDKLLRYAGGSMPWPKVLRMLRYIKIPYRNSPQMWSKRGVLKRDQGRCGYCGAHATTVDHILPISRDGGRREWLNTIAACQPCNNRKGNKTPAEARMTLLVTPFVPRGAY